MRDRLGQRPGRQRGELTGPNPVDRGKRGSKIHLLVDRAGLPSSVGISAANTHDKLALAPLVRGIPPIQSRRPAPPQARQAARRQRLRLQRPAALAALAGYHPAHRPSGIEPSDRLGRHRWVVERTVSWLSICRRLHCRYERKPEHFLASRRRRDVATAASDATARPARPPCTKATHYIGFITPDHHIA
jgi:transposase